MMNKIPEMGPQASKALLIPLLTVLHFTIPARAQPEEWTPRIPVIDGPSWRIVEAPDLDSLNGPDPEKQHVVDHGFIRASNGRWQLWACIRGTAIGRLLYAWEGESLEKGPWVSRGIAARADPAYGEKVDPKSIQAPFSLKIGDLYHLFYNSNGIRLMTSTDGIHFARHLDAEGNNVLYAEGGRDVMVLQDANRFYSYSTVSTGAGDGWKRGFVILRTSDDLKRWSDYTIVSEGGVAGNGPGSAESPFVIRIDGYYYLFRSSSITGKTYVYRSTFPYHFGVNDDSKPITDLPIKAPEIILDHGRYYVSDLADFKASNSPGYAGSAICLQNIMASNDGSFRVMEREDNALPQDPVAKMPGGA